MLVTKVRDRENSRAQQTIYRLSRPITYGYEHDDSKTQHIVVSATIVEGSGPETYIFPADENGVILDWLELPGSYGGGLEHDYAIERFIAHYDR